MNELTKEDILKQKLNRSISQTTIIRCAICGHAMRVNNRHKVPWKVNVYDGLAIILFNCTNCNAEYDLAMCDVGVNNDICWCA
jgi:DNA-directed RNA polymerase subunit RPC12/RpoP